MTQAVREKLRTLIERIAAASADSHWNEFAGAWLDGRLMRGEFVDYCTGQPATPAIFVFDCKVAAVAASSDRHVYPSARMREYAACAVKYLEAGDLVTAERFARKAADALRQLPPKTAR